MYIRFTLLLATVLLFLFSCNKEKKMKDDFYKALQSLDYEQKRDFKDFMKTARAFEGHPSIFNPYLKEIDFQFIDYYKLDTKNDSIEIYLGHLNKNGDKRNWFSLFVNDSIENFYVQDFTQDKDIFKEELGNDFSTDISFNFYNNKYATYLKLKYLDTIQRKLEYSWSKGFEPRDSITISMLEPLYLGNKIPEIGLRNIDGEKINLKEFNSQTIVLFYCNLHFNICLEQIPYLNRLEEKYTDEDVRFIAVLDDNAENIRSYIEKNSFNYQIALLDKASVNLFGNGKPLNLIINKKGVVSFYKRGSCKNHNCIYDELVNELKNLFDKDI